MTGIFPHIEVSQRLSLFNALQIIIWIGGFCATHVIVVLSHKLGIAEVNKLVVHSAADDVDVVVEVLGLDCLEIQVELETGILHRTHIYKRLCMQIGWY